MTPTGQFCDLCWIERRQRMAALYVILGDPFCKSCAEQNFTQEVLESATRVCPAPVAAPAPTSTQTDKDEGEAVAMTVKNNDRRPCLGENCKATVGAKSTSGLCPRCYARETYRLKQSKKTPRATPPQHGKGHAVAAPVPRLAEPVGDGITITISPRVLDTWWQRLSVDVKAQAFSAFLEKMD